MVTNVVEELIVLKSRIKLKIAEYELRTGNKFINKNAADKLDMLPQHFSALVNGKVLTTVEKTFKLAILLDCKVDDLYEFEDLQR
ncbi:XRE family transcriptional regulator [Paenibacillus sp. LjRoot56]|uniref:XRE family transcriptional regulator n=1 Tax=Paenibacillus sp. LjRoot56 TaxID=3342333 RepID=UPI003ECD8ABC